MFHHIRIDRSESWNSDLDSANKEGNVVPRAKSLAAKNSQILRLIKHGQRCTLFLGA